MHKVPFDLDAYEQHVRNSDCFICEIVAGARADHCIVSRDDVHVAFLAKWPTLRGCCLVAPIEHRTAVVDDFDEVQYVELQRRVHRVGRAVARAVPTERLYVLSLGSDAANAHVHWHVAPLPPGVPYREQQYIALMHENGVFDLSDDEMEAIAQRIRDHLETSDR